MRKCSWLCFLLLLGSLALQAQQQKKYVYEEDTVGPPPPAEENYSPTESKSGTQVVEAPESEDTEIEKAETRTDTTLYRNYVHLSRDTVQRLKTMGALAYTRYLDSLLRADQDKNKDKEPTGSRRSVSMPSMSFGFLTPLLWILAAAFVAFILYTLFLKDGAFRKISKKSLGSQEDMQLEEVKPGSDMDRLIKQALQNKNYRLAIRYLYLNSLYKLAEKGLVQFAVDKTNYQYVSELTHQEQRNEFAKLTLHYEYVWYGEFEIDETVYKKIEPGFTAFYNKI